MRLFGVIVVIEVMKVYSASKIFVPNDDEALTAAAVSIIDRCFGSPERWSELLIITEQDSHRIVPKIHHDSVTSNSILFTGRTESNQFEYSKKRSDYFETIGQWQESKPTAVIIGVRSVEQLEFILSTLKTDVRSTWRPRSKFLIILEPRCNVTESNDMLKVIWEYWILDAILLCSSQTAAVRNQSEIELYTFNPYSADHPPQWETIIQETVEVSIDPGNFNHSWYIFNQRFAGIRSSKHCGHVFFDKTSNLDGYVIPIIVMHPVLLSDSGSNVIPHYETNRRFLKTIKKMLRFNVAQVLNNHLDKFGRSCNNNSYSGPLDDIHHERSHIIPSLRSIDFSPGLGSTYPYNMYSACFASRISGFRPQWMNITSARHIWLGLGFSMIFFTFVLYLQNKPYGMVSAILDAERFITGSSIIHISKTFKHRIVLGSIFVVLLVVDGSIRGRFISILTLARELPNLDTLEQLKKHDVNLYGYIALKNGIVDPELRERYNGNVTFAGCIAALERGESQRACFTSCEILPFRIMNSSIIYGSPIPYWITPMAFITTLNWPMTNRYSFEVQKIVRSGIHGKWNSDIAWEYQVKAWKQKRAAVTPYVRPTKLNDLLPAFALLFVGLSATLIVFAWEMKRCKSFHFSNFEN